MNLAIVHYHLNRGGVARVIENQLLALDCVLGGDQRWRAAVFHGGRKAGWDEQQLARRLRNIELQLIELPGLDYDTSDDEGVADSTPSELTKDVGQAVPDSLTKDIGQAVPDSSNAPRASSVRHSLTYAADETLAAGDDLATRLIDALTQIGFSPGRTVVQIHNHSLGKNATLAGCVEPLACSGYALVLQIHDFAEDFRPANYRRATALGADRLYPQGEGIHYAVLNGRDHAMLRRAGAAEGRLHLLPNPVVTLEQLPDRTAARAKLQRLFDVTPEERFVLYPIRAIRRKNLGEALLAGLLSPPGTVVGVTLAPLNPVERPVYAMWKETAEQWRLPCRFEVSEAGAVSFAEAVAAADAMLTTSVAEGFGMVMLESWPAGRPLLGRDLPEITGDFTRSGLRLDDLWARLAVPLDWIGSERFAHRASDAYRRAVEGYRRPLPPDWEQAIRDKARDGTVDFGDLDESMQKDVMRRVLDDPGARQNILAINLELEEKLALDARAAAATIEHNVRIVEERFSLVPSGRRLANLLTKILEGPRGGRPSPLPHPGRILNEFLDARRFRMVRG